MNTTEVYNNTFLNSLFTSKEFSFINNMDSDTKKFDNMLKSQELHRDLIVTYINSLNDLASNQKSSSAISSVLDEAKNAFELVNENIKSIRANLDSSNALNTNIVNLLIKMESNTNTTYTSFVSEAQDLKNKINDYSNLLQSSESKIASNNSKIEEFLRKNNISNSVEFDYTKPSNAYHTVTPSHTPNYETETESTKNQPITFAKSNNVLVVSEKRKRVFLPYSEKEVLEYLEQYPNQYKSFDDVIKKEFIFPVESYLKHPVIARFRESYSLIRDREAKSIFDAFKFAMDMMFHYDLNPAIIAACKSENQLENYLNCLNRKKLDEFKDFEIIFEVNPI